MGKHMGALNTDNLFAKMMGGITEPAAAAPDTLPKQKRDSAKAKESADKLPVTDTAVRIHQEADAAARKLLRAKPKPFRYEAGQPGDERIKRSYFITARLAMALEDRSIKEKRKGMSGELSDIVQAALTEYLADELEAGADFWAER